MMNSCARRILVLYGTTEGQTGKVAAAIGETLRSAGLAAEVVNAAGERDPEPEDFAGIIVAASVHAGGYQRPVARWVRTHAVALRGRPTVFVSVCLGVLEHNPKVDQTLNEIMQRFFNNTGWQPSQIKIVAGALPYSKYNWLTRRMMKRIVAKAHGDTDTSRDYEYTDWQDLDLFARRFAETVSGTERVSVAS